MYSKLTALPGAQLQLAGNANASHDTYSLQWVAERSGLSQYAADLEELAHRSAVDRISVRPDWRATVARQAGWAETVLLLRHNGATEAAVFLRERLVAGVRTGYLQGASTLGDTLILCDPARETFYLGLLAQLLLHSGRAFLLVLHRPAEAATDLELPTGLRQTSTGSLLHWELPLQRDLEATIHGFSHRTRRNIRNYLRRIDASDWRFHPNLDMQTTASAVHDLAGRCTHPFSPQVAEERLDVARNTEGGFSMGLTNAAGEWLCCLIGRRTPQATEIFWQLNAAGARKLSLCVAMRALMTREEIRRGVPVVQYIGGTCALSLPTDARYTAIARPGLRLWLLRMLVRLNLLRGPVLRDLL